MEEIILTKENMLELYSKLKTLKTVEIQRYKDGKLTTTAVGTFMDVFLDDEDKYSVMLIVGYDEEIDVGYNINFAEGDILCYTDKNSFYTDVNASDGYCRRVFNFDADTTNISSIEDKIFELEEIRIIIRASRYTLVKAYNYERKAPGSMTVKDWLNTRIKPAIGGLEVEILRGDGQIMIHPSANLESIRSSYKLD
jgi:hypothetical protein